MGKLNQIIAVVSGKKQEAKDAITKCYHLIQKSPLFDGINKTYRPKEDEGDKLPSEEKLIQVKVKDLVSEVSDVLTKMFDTVATQDWTNCEAKADIKVNNEVLVPQVPVTHLMFLEKQVKDLETFVSKLPTLDPSETWTFSDTAGAYATKPADTTNNL